MSPAASPRPASTLKTTVVAAGLLLLAGVFVLIFVLQLTQDPDVDVNLSSGTFEVGKARQLAPPVDREGPLLFQDLLGRGRHIYVQHLGDDPLTGWLAVGAVAPGQPERCAVKWDQKRGVFEDPCTKATYPPEGTGLTQYPTEVNRKKKGGPVVIVDLRTSQ